MSDSNDLTSPTGGAGDDGAGSRVGSADADRGNLDGTTAVNGPREDSLEQAKGNGSFNDASDKRTDDSDEARMASDAGDSGQDGGSMS